MFWLKLTFIIVSATACRNKKTTNSNSRHKSCFLDIIFGSWRAEPNQIMLNILNILVILNRVLIGSNSHLGCCVGVTTDSAV